MSLEQLKHFIENLLNNMGAKDLLNYVVFDNPISKTVLRPFYGNYGSHIPSPPVAVITEHLPLWQLALQQGPFVRIAGISGAAAVMLGAYGSHKTYPKDKVKELKAIYETGNKFHFIHTLALLGTPLCRCPRVSGLLMLTGTVLFSGPCYYHAFTGDDKFGKLAPIGGTVLLLAWLSMVF